MTISSPSGRLLGAGAQPQIRLAGNAAAADWTLVDYFDVELAKGSVAGKGSTFSLPKLEPGWYRVTCRDAAGQEARLELGVVLDRGGAPLPVAGKVAGDAASAWLLPRRTAEDFRAFAGDVARAGIPWVRERLRWAEVEPAPGRFEWGRYDLAAQALAAAGVRVCQVWHDSPVWSHAGTPQSPCPDDLRAVYRFARAAAERFRGSIQAWEIWNEPDIHFWGELADRYAGFVKAAALGLRAGNPEAIVLPGALCSGDTAFARAVAAQGVLGYGDAFGWHSYKPPSEYATELGEYRRLAAESGAQLGPAWITEAGIRRPGTTGTGGRELSDADLREQARYVPRSVVASLAAGNARHFFFVLPDYLERGTQYGARRPDGSPHPAFVALSAAANLLGTGRYLGPLPAQRGEAHVFAVGRKTVVVAWGEPGGAAKIPTERQSVEVADLFGAAKTVSRCTGHVPLRLGPDPVYVLDVGPALRRRMGERPGTGPTAERPVRPPAVVVAGFARLPFAKDRNAYTLPAAAATATGFTYVVELVNLDEQAAASGAVELVLPTGWRAQPGVLRPADAGEGASRSYALEPMGRLTYEVVIVPAGGGLRTERLAVQATVGKATLPPAISEFQRDAESLGEAAARPLAWDDAAGWSATRTADEIATVEPAGAGRFSITGRRTAGGGECWWEVERRLDRPVDLSGFDGIACELAGSAGEGDAFVYLMLAGPDGTFRSAGGACPPAGRTVRFLFRDLSGGAGKPAAARVKIGIWAGGGKVDVTAGSFRLVRLSEPQ